MPFCASPAPARTRLGRRRAGAAAAVLLLVLVAAGLLAACGSSSSGRSSSTGATPPPSSTVPTRSSATTGAGSGGVIGGALSLSVLPAPWTLPVSGSRQAVCWDGSAIVEMGGLAAGDTSTGAVRAFDPVSGLVTASGQLPHPLHDAAGACLAGRAVMFGGGGSTTVATVQAWKPGGAGQVIGSLPTPRSDVTAAVIGDTAYVIGGFDGSTMQLTVLATRDGSSFQPVGQLQVGVRYPAVAVADGDIWVVGGQIGTSEGGGSQTDVIQRFDPRTGATTVVGHLPEPLGHAMAAFLAGTLWVVGGVTGSTTSSQVWAIDPSTSRVSARGSLPTARSDAGTAVVGGTAYLLGGEGSAGPTAPLDSVLELRAAGGSS